jgi:ATP-binding cassette subfamily F protein uup
LEEFLSDYTGCLLLVSHDRYFLDHTIDQLFVFEGEGQIYHFPGNYSVFHENKIKQGLLQKSTESVAKIKSQVAKSEKSLPIKKKITYAELKEYETIEKEIGDLEEEKKALEEKLNSGELAFSELQVASSRMADIIDTIENKMLRWMELEDLK